MRGMESSSAGSSLGSLVLELFLDKEGAETCKVLEQFLTMVSTESSSFCKKICLARQFVHRKLPQPVERPVSSHGCALSPRSTKGNSSDHVVTEARVKRVLEAAVHRWTQGDKLLFACVKYKHFAKLKPKIGSTVGGKSFARGRRKLCFLKCQ
jgi:hypothetical protein